ncbi:hypothetical protein WL30_32655 [Burkholderia ubonensis]|uniref:Uncharacterized protein n=2 Tax=Burkholderia ubonensis TaxID=101571 RepID=A0A107FBU1_9BURK|nr:hypothetical protein WL30_32655 [Burkholderia ubonensis]KWB15994.1 hypothetical protein WL31_14235 [Burkholderia ubonensis]KWD74349.1 hypothetical protein WL70_27635 [Burkholderia ubonensis]KWD90644.1 hypothetical protein WL71_00980 [Burkholderia ubonensis]KWE02475.1 hypothetical protein WL72_05490 [Burkholderia ubonensis]
MLHEMDRMRREGFSTFNSRLYAARENVTKIAGEMQASLFPGRIERAEIELDAVTGGGEHGKSMLEEFCFYVERGLPPPYHMLQTFAHLFRDVMDGGAWEVAFPLPGRAQSAIKSSREEPKAVIDRKIAIAMAKRRKTYPAETIDASIQHVAAVFGRSDKVIERAWYGPYGKSLRNMPTK